VTDTIVDGAGEENPGWRVLVGTDLEIAYSLASDDLVIRVNKSGAQVFRVVLEDARKQVSERELLNFSGASPDLVFKNRSNRRGDRQCGGIASDRWPAR